MRPRREPVHVRAGDLQLVGDLGGLVDHLLLRERIGQSVVRRRIDCLHVAHPKAEPRSREEVGRLAHGFHPPGDSDAEIAGADRLIREADRAHPGGAHLVDGLRRNLARDAGLDLGLA